MKEKKDWSTKSILIVEDNDINALLLKSIIQPTKAKTTIVKKVSDFFTNIKSNKHDLILMDINLKDKDYDGIKLNQYMKDNNINTPVIIQSAVDDIYNKKIDCDGIVEKPIIIHKLLCLISKIFGIQKF